MPAFTHTDGHHLSVDGARLYHEAIGPADGPALLMLHGGLGSMTDLNPIAERLAGRWRLIGIDLRGHGRSTLGNTPLRSLLGKDISIGDCHGRAIRYKSGLDIVNVDVS